MLARECEENNIVLQYYDYLLQYSVPKLRFILSYTVNNLF